MDKLLLKIVQDKPASSSIATSSPERFSCPHVPGRRISIEEWEQRHMMRRLEHHQDSLFQE